MMLTIWCLENGPFSKNHMVRRGAIHVVHHLKPLDAECGFELRILVLVWHMVRRPPAEFEIEIAWCIVVGGAADARTIRTSL